MSGSSTRRAEWAALVPWSGVQSKPAWMGPGGESPVINIENVTNLTEIINGLEPTAKTLQIGYVALSAGQQAYNVSFTEPMSGVPKVELQDFLDDDDGEQFSAAVSAVSSTGFRFVLSGVPLTSAGRMQYRAFIQDQP